MGKASVIFSIDENAQKECLLAGRDSAATQTMVATEPTKELLRFATIDRDGNATIDMRRPVLLRDVGSSRAFGYAAFGTASHYMSKPSATWQDAFEAFKEACEVYTAKAERDQSERDKAERERVAKLRTALIDWMDGKASKEVEDLGAAHEISESGKTITFRHAWGGTKRVSSEQLGPDNGTNLWDRVVASATKRIEAARVQAEAREAAKQEAAKKADAERIEWIKQYGSSRLKKCLKHGFDCLSAYRDERMALERPGWRLDDGFTDAWDSVKNPTEAQLDWLDSLQESAKDAKLSRLQVDGEWYTGALCEYLGQKLAQIAPDEIERMAQNETNEYE